MRFYLPGTVYSIVGPVSWFRGMFLFFSQRSTVNNDGHTTPEKSMPPSSSLQKNSNTHTSTTNSELKMSVESTATKTYTEEDLKHAVRAMISNSTATYEQMRATHGVPKCTLYKELKNVARYVADQDHVFAFLAVDKRIIDGLRRVWGGSCGQNDLFHGQYVICDALLNMSKKRPGRPMNNIPPSPTTKRENNRKRNKERAANVLSKGGRKRTRKYAPGKRPLWNATHRSNKKQ